MRSFQSNLPLWLGAAVAFSALMLAPTAAARVIYVKWDAGGVNDGTSWANAYVYLQDALAASACGDEIWVAAGGYNPGSMPADTFSPRSGVGVYGGFAGTETERDQRDPVLNSTALGKLLDVQPHVVTAINVDSNAVLDGFAISAVTFSGIPSDNRGAAIYMLNSSMNIIDCRLSGMVLGLETGPNSG